LLTRYKTKWYYLYMLETANKKYKLLREKLK
jgi:hypothetical protein